MPCKGRKKKSFTDNQQSEKSVLQKEISQSIQIVKQSPAAYNLCSKYIPKHLLDKVLDNKSETASKSPVGSSDSSTFKAVADNSKNVEERITSIVKTDSNETHEEHLESGLSNIQDALSISNSSSETQPVVRDSLVKAKLSEYLGHNNTCIEEQSIERYTVTVLEEFIVCEDSQNSEIEESTISVNLQEVKDIESPHVNEAVIKERDCSSLLKEIKGQAFHSVSEVILTGTNISSLLKEDKEADINQLNEKKSEEKSNSHQQEIKLVSLEKGISQEAQVNSANTAVTSKQTTVAEQTLEKSAEIKELIIAQKNLQAIEKLEAKKEDNFKFRSVRNSRAARLDYRVLAGIKREETDAEVFKKPKVVKRYKPYIRKPSEKKPAPKPKEANKGNTVGFQTNLAKELTQVQAVSSMIQPAGGKVQQIVFRLMSTQKEKGISKPTKATFTSAISNNIASQAKSNMSDRYPKILPKITLPKRIIIPTTPHGSTSTNTSTTQPTALPVNNISLLPTCLPSSSNSSDSSNRKKKIRNNMAQTMDVAKGMKSKIKKVKRSKSLNSVNVKELKNARESTEQVKSPKNKLGNSSIQFDTHVCSENEKVRFMNSLGITREEKKRMGIPDSHKLGNMIDPKSLPICRRPESQQRRPAKVECPAKWLPKSETPLVPQGTSALDIDPLPSSSAKNISGMFGTADPFYLRKKPKQRHLWNEQDHAEEWPVKQENRMKFVDMGSDKRTQSKRLNLSENERCDMYEEIYDSLDYVMDNVFHEIDRRENLKTIRKVFFDRGVGPPPESDDIQFLTHTLKQRLGKQAQKTSLQQGLRKIGGIADETQSRGDGQCTSDDDNVLQKAISNDDEALLKRLKSLVDRITNDGQGENCQNYNKNDKLMYGMLIRAANYGKYGKPVDKSTMAVPDNPSEISKRNSSQESMDSSCYIVDTTHNQENHVRINKSQDSIWISSSSNGSPLSVPKSQDIYQRNYELYQHSYPYCNIPSVSTGDSDSTDEFNYRSMPEPLDLSRRGNDAADSKLIKNQPNECGTFRSGLDLLADVASRQAYLPMPVSSPNLSTHPCKCDTCYHTVHVPNRPNPTSISHGELTLEKNPRENIKLLESNVAEKFYDYNTPNNKSNTTSDVETTMFYPERRLDGLTGYWTVKGAQLQTPNLELPIEEREDAMIPLYDIGPDDLSILRNNVHVLDTIDQVDYKEKETKKESPTTAEKDRLILEIKRSRRHRREESRYSKATKRSHHTVSESPIAFKQARQDSEAYDKMPSNVSPSLLAVVPRSREGEAPKKSTNGKQITDKTTANRRLKRSSISKNSDDESSRKIQKTLDEVASMSFSPKESKTRAHQLKKRKSTQLPTAATLPLESDNNSETGNVVVTCTVVTVTKDDKCKTERPGRDFSSSTSEMRNIDISMERGVKRSRDEDDDDVGNMRKSAKTC